MKRNFFISIILVSSLVFIVDVQADGERGYRKHSSNSSDGDCALKKLDCKFPCEAAVPIDSVPFCADKPGKYCVTKDLCYRGSDAAITVKADGVFINFAGHDLKLSNKKAVGIYAKDVKELTVQNDVIFASDVSKDPSSVAIKLVRCEKVTLDNIFTANTFYGVHALGCNDVNVSHAHFKNHIGGGDTFDTNSGGFRSDNSKAVVVEHSVLLVLEKVSQKETELFKLCLEMVLIIAGFQTVNLLM